MNRITDNDILSIIKDLGPCSRGMIAEALQDKREWDKNELNKITRKLNSLVKYRYIIRRPHKDIYYYSFPEDKRPIPENYEGNCIYKIEEYLKGLPMGATVTIKELTDKFECCPSHARRVINRNPAFTITNEWNGQHKFNLYHKRYWGVF